MNEKCKFFDVCTAPMCPMCEKLENYVWFADEEICRLKDVPDWVKRQRKIAKKGLTADAGCFTLSMLERQCYVGKSIKGINPEAVDDERKKAEKDWLFKHQPVKERTNKEKERLAAQVRFERSKFLKNDV